MALIELDNVSKTYRIGDIETEALSNINLSIEENEFVAIMGPSGSGKSTLMHILGLLDIPSAGSYALNGVDVSRLHDTELAERRRDNIGFVFQNFFLVPRLSVRSNIELPLVYAHLKQSERRQKVDALLQQVDLAEHGYKRPNQISGGQRQRVAIARALANQPKLILADEPTGNLDSKTGETILGLLSSIHKSGGTVIVVTHDEQIARLAQRIIYIKDGQTVKSL